MRTLPLYYGFTSNMASTMAAATTGAPKRSKVRNSSACMRAQIVLERFGLRVHMLRKRLESRVALLLKSLLAGLGCQRLAFFFHLSGSSSAWGVLNPSNLDDANALRVSKAGMAHLLMELS